MYRRAALTVVASTAVAGCSSLSGPAEPPEAEDRTVEVLARSCGRTGEHSATVSFGSDQSRVEIDGTIRVPRTDQRLSVDTRSGVGYEGRASDEMEVRIHYLSPDSASNADGSDCEGTLEYEARVTFSAVPSSVQVRHVTEDHGDEVLKTVTTSHP